MAAPDNSDARDSEEQAIAVPLVWTDEDVPPVLYANHFAIQHAGGAFFLSIGQFAPPIILGSEEERREQLKQLTFLPVRTVGRYLLGHHEMTELLGLLRRHLERFPAPAGEEADPGAN